MNRQLVCTLLVIVCAGVAATNVRADYTFTTLDDPAASQVFGHGTYPVAMSGNTVVGYYSDSQLVSHGFAETNGVFTTLDDPAEPPPPPAGTMVTGVPQGTMITAISGDTVYGYYRASNNWDVGFTESGGVYSPFPVPAGMLLAIPRAVSGDTVVGTYAGADEVSHAFIETNGLFTTLDDPAAGPPQPTTTLTGVSGNVVTGYITGEGFTETGGLFTPLHGDGLPFSIFPAGISGNTIVGILGSGGSFIYTDGAFRPFDFPGENGTYLSGISGSTIFGYYIDSQNQSHGFVATESTPEPCSLAFFGMGAVTLLKRRRALR